MLELISIAAVGTNGVIGSSNGGMPWHYPEDLKHYKQTTMGHPLLMGRRTYENIIEQLGHPLPGRKPQVVLTSGELDTPEQVIVVNSLEAAWDAVSGLDTAIYNVGGGSIYEQFFPITDRLILSRIPESPQGDVRFPAVDETTWKLRETDERESFVIETWDRRGALTHNSNPVRESE